MFLPVTRRLMEADVANNTISNSLAVPSASSSENVIFGNSSFFNSSGVGMVDFEESELGYSDVQTVFLACIATLIPLVFILVAAIGVRFLYRRFRARKGEGYEGVLQREESSDPLAVKSLSASGNLLTDEVTLEDGSTKTTTTKFTTSASPHENNVFVVEVQQGGVPRSGDCFRGDAEVYPKLSSSAVSSQEDIDEEDGSRRSSSQRAQVHRPPDIDVDEVSDEDDLEDGDDEEEDDDTADRKANREGAADDGQDGSTNTGLSQSDLSISSSGSNNPSYRYGNQVGYEGGHFGYPQYIGYSASDEKVERTVGGGGRSAAPKRNAPVAIVMKRASSVTEANEKPASNQIRGRYSIDVTPASTRLLSDMQAIERHRLQEERLQEEQRQLGNGTVKAVANGDATPSPIEEKEEEKQTDEDANSKPAVEADKQDANDDKVDDESAAKKRASLPIITPELYTQFKQTTKSLILDKTARPGLSPKFEKFRNENSPLDETEKDVNNDAPQGPETAPAKSQEYENEAFIPSDQIAS
ncbi:transcriptional regulator ATRX homolog isoform X3 [Periplaneta americana]|uniref:transcriptional regulator ATRX homolog isoform X3 n=1 Tax=Periplaneta americana TaxID=6978 RepID=UPI0037E9A352